MELTGKEQQRERMYETGGVGGGLGRRQQRIGARVAVLRVAYGKVESGVTPNMLAVIRRSHDSK